MPRGTTVCRRIESLINTTDLHTIHREVRRKESKKRRGKKKKGTSRKLGSRSREKLADREQRTLETSGYDRLSLKILQRVGRAMVG